MLNLSFELGKLEICDALQLFFLFELCFELFKLFLVFLDLLLLPPFTYFELFISRFSLCTLGLLLLSFLFLGLFPLLFLSCDCRMRFTVSCFIYLFVVLFVLRLKLRDFLLLLRSCLCFSFKLNCQLADFCFPHSQIFLKSF